MDWLETGVARMAMAQQRHRARRHVDENRLATVRRDAATGVIPQEAQRAGNTPTTAVVAICPAATPQSVTPMINTRSRVDGRALDWTRARSTDRTAGSAATLRILAIGAACSILCACGGGGGGGGSDASVTPPAPAPAELAWDNGNWDQQEWK